MVTASATRPAAIGETVDLADVQGNILRGYRKARVRHVVVCVTDARRGRAWIAAATARDTTAGPRITDGGHWSHPPATCFNVGITAAGMRAFGVPDAVVQTFPAPWREGMAARAAIIGDWGDSDPANWHERFRDPASVHMIVSLHADTDALLDEITRAAMALPGGNALRVVGQDDGERFEGNAVHFGYRDNIAQPRFDGITHPGKYDDQPLAPLGTVLLGYDTDMEELRWSLPNPAVLGFNGAFSAYRVLEQDVVGFEAFLDRAADEVLRSPGAEELLPSGAESQIAGVGATRHAAMREVVAAKLMGRWRNGTPLTVSPTHPTPQPGVPTNDFDYADDPQGMKCPYGSHIRRGNPRGGKIVQRVSNHTRRVVRRGFPYGPPYDPSRPENVERGLLGNFLCANLEAQFEALMYDWLNLGLLDPRLLASNDPLVGANEESASLFKLPTRKGTIVLRGIPRFVRTRGGAYTLLPGLSALRWIGSLPG